ncbi:MAG: VCBS repeat-containing protein, partial [Gemmatimonadetes bacterium]|nr:VCBS repeat-containing protein [Gemmatimonadota bacterium]
RLDVYCVQSCPLPGYVGADAEAPPPIDRLYRNLGGFRFESVGPLVSVAVRQPDGSVKRVEKPLGLDDARYGMGVSCPDVDNDGDPDLFVTNVGRDALYRNEGDGTFTD